MAKKPVEPTAAESATEPRQVTISFPVSEPLHFALKLRALQERTTVRAMVLTGLKAIGLDVPADDLIDRRAGRAGRPKGS
jgi:hypothetical protein